MIDTVSWRHDVGSQPEDHDKGICFRLILARGHGLSVSRAHRYTSLSSLMFVVLVLPCRLVFCHPDLRRPGKLIAHGFVPYP